MFIVLGNEIEFETWTIMFMFHCVNQLAKLKSFQAIGKWDRLSSYTLAKRPILEKKLKTIHK